VEEFFGRLETRAGLTATSCVTGGAAASVATSASGAALYDEFWFNISVSLEFEVEMEPVSSSLIAAKHTCSSRSVDTDSTH